MPLVCPNLRTDLISWWISWHTMASFAAGSFPNATGMGVHLKANQMLLAEAVEVVRSSHFFNVAGSFCAQNMSCRATRRMPSKPIEGANANQSVLSNPHIVSWNQGESGTYKTCPKRISLSEEGEGVFSTQPRGFQVTADGRIHQSQKLTTQIPTFQPLEDFAFKKWLTGTLHHSRLPAYSVK